MAGNARAACREIQERIGEALPFALPLTCINSQGMHFVIIDRGAAAVVRLSRSACIHPS